MATTSKSASSDKPKSAATDKPKSAVDKPKSVATERPKSQRTAQKKTTEKKTTTKSSKPATIKKPQIYASPKKTKATKVKAAKPADEGKSHPTWKEMIKQCIVESRERTGVSRPVLKKMIHERFGLDAITDNVESSRFTRAIQNGVEDGTFALPKGPSGKVKLAPKTKPEPTNENAAPIPAKRTTPTKMAAPKKASTTAAKAGTVKKAPAKAAKAKASTTSKKQTTVKSAEKKKAAVKAAVTKVTKVRSTAPKVGSKSKPRAKKAAA